MHALWRTFFPQTCPGCQKVLDTPQALCSDCTPVQAHLTHQTVLQDTHLPHLVYLGPAEGKWRRIVHALKYQGNRNVALSLGQGLAETVPAHWRLDCLCPVPLHPRREQERGYNQSKILAEAVGTHLKVPTRDLLRRTVYTSQQAKLHHAQRKENLQKAFELASPVQGLNVLLIDDVLSTGATLKACAQLLKTAGVGKVYFLVVAR